MKLESTVLSCSSRSSFPCLPASKGRVLCSNRAFPTSQKGVQGKKKWLSQTPCTLKHFALQIFLLPFFAVHSSLTLEILFKMFFSFLHHLMFCYRKINLSWAKSGFAGCAGHFAALGTRWESNANVAFYPVCLCFLQGLMYEAANWQQTELYPFL